MKTKPKVLFLARWYPDRYDPMTGLFIQRHAEVAAGFTDVAVLYLRAAPDIQGGYQVEHKNVNGVFETIVYYGTKSKLPGYCSKWLAGYKFVKSFFTGYKSILKNWHKPDLIHVNVLTRLGILALYLKWFYKISYVVTEHWSRYLPVTGTFKGILRKIFTRLVVRNAAAISTVSVNLATAMQNHGLKNRNYMVLPNVVDTEIYVPATISKLNDRIPFMHISCFEDRSKNITGILKAIHKLSLIRNDFECFMVGEGVNFDEMKLLAANLNLTEPLVRFTGLLENESLVKAYQSAVFTVMFSNYENMPVVISESFACGLPVLATSVGGIPEWVNNNTGRLVPVGNEEQFLQALCFMLDHYQEFNRQEIRDIAVKSFSKDAVAEKLKELYRFAG